MELADLQLYGISVDEFALHDASLDLILAVQAQRMAAGDRQRLVERLKIQRSELQLACAQLKLREAEASKLANVAARTNNAVVITDSEGKIEWVNDGFVRLTGFSLTELVGKTAGMLLQGAATDPKTVEFMRGKIAAQEGFKAELINYAKDGRHYWVALDVQPVRDETGSRVTHYIAIQQEITERVESEQRRQLQQAVSTALGEAETLAQGISSVLSLFGGAVAARLGGFGLAESFGDLAVEYLFWSSGDRCEGLPTESYFADLEGRLNWSEGEEWPRIIEAATAEPVPSHGLSAVAIACRADRRLVGKIILAGVALPKPSGEMLRLLDLLSNQIGQFIVRQQARLELQRSRDFALKVMHLMGQGLTVTDEKGTFSFVNEAFAAVVARSRQSLIGMNPAELVPEDQQEVFRQVLAEQSRGITSAYQTQLVQPGGVKIPVMITGVPRHENGRIIGTIAVITDLTEPKRVESQMAEALTRERELNALKSSFITMASHEFRTPLTSIVYAHDLLGNCVQALPEATAGRAFRYLGIIFDSTRRMSELMDDLLLLGRIESGKFNCVPIPVDLLGFLEELKRQAGEGQSRVSIEIGSGLPTLALLDPNILRHALLNLLINALKYSSAPAKVTLSLCLENEAGSSLRFQIRDQGCGIPAADQEKLFQPFFRASNVGKIRGTGIGLTIARDCARLHGGELTVISQLGVGTTASLKVPYWVGS
jgi:PAS domain S-box-containing protein